MVLLICGRDIFDPLSPSRSPARIPRSRAPRCRARVRVSRLR
jgi:hypothetical protein